MQTAKQSFHIAVIPAILLAMLLMLLLSACDGTPETVDSNPPASDSVEPSLEPVNSPEPSPEPEPSLNPPPILGTTETFNSYYDFRVEVTNVREVRKEIGMMDGGVLGEHTVFVCYPGAVVTVLNAGMGDPADPAWYSDGLYHPYYGFLWTRDENTVDTLRITEDTGPVEVTPDLTGIYFLESGDGLLRFELYKE